MFHRGFFLSFFVNVSTDFMEAPSIMKVRVCGGEGVLGAFPFFVSECISDWKGASPPGFEGWAL